ncbi:MAG: hypothetical protein ACRDOI_33350, partial [Trebonia sp.]
MQAGPALKGVERLDDVRDAVVDAEPGVRAAEIGAHPAGGHRPHRPLSRTARHARTTRPADSKR